MMADAGIPTPKYYVAETVAQATKAAHDLGGTDCVLKAQVGAMNYFHSLLIHRLLSHLY